MQSFRTMDTIVTVNDCKNNHIHVCIFLHIRTQTHTLFYI